MCVDVDLEECGVFGKRSATFSGAAVVSWLASRSRATPRLDWERVYQLDYQHIQRHGHTRYACTQSALDCTLWNTVNLLMVFRQLALTLHLSDETIHTKQMLLDHIFSLNISFSAQSNVDE